MRMRGEYYAGFIQKKPAWMEAFGALKARIAAFLVDYVAIFYFIVITSYCITEISGYQGSFFLIPWWIFLIVVSELVVLWETFGISLGMRAAGIRLTTADGSTVPFHRGIIRYLAWHISALPVIGCLAILWNRDRLSWHDRISRTKIEKQDETDKTRITWYKSSHGISIALLVFFTLLAGVFITEINLHTLFTGASKTGRLWKALLTPDWAVLGTGINLLIVTIFMALMATLFAIVFAVPLSFLAARNLMHGFIGRSVYTVVRVIMSITRSIEPIIWAIIFVVWVRLGTFPGVLALFVHSIADLTKLYSERLESIDPGPVEAIKATGASQLQVILYGIVPQIVNPYLSFTLYRWDINVRMATVIGIVGGGGIGQRLYHYTRHWQWHAAGTLMLLIIVTVWAIDYLSSRLRESLE